MDFHCVELVGHCVLVALNPNIWFQGEDYPLLFGRKRSDRWEDKLSLAKLVEGCIGLTKARRHVEG